MILSEACYNCNSLFYLKELITTLHKSYTLSSPHTFYAIVIQTYIFTYFVTFNKLLYLGIFLILLYFNFHIRFKSDFFTTIVVLEF